MNLLGIQSIGPWDVENYKCPVCGRERFFTENAGIMQELSDEQVRPYLFIRNVNLLFSGSSSRGNANFETDQDATSHASPKAVIIAALAIIALCIVFLGYTIKIW